MTLEYTISLLATITGYLFIPVALAFILKKDIGSRNRILIVVLNATLVYFLFAWLNYLGNGYLPEGDILPASTWSFIAYLIFKKKQERLEYIKPLNNISKSDHKSPKWGPVVSFVRAILFWERATWWQPQPLAVTF